MTNASSSMRYIHFVLTAFCLSCASNGLLAKDPSDISSADVTQPKEVSDANPPMLKEAIEFVQKGEFEKAVPAYQKMVEAYPTNPKTHISLAWILLKAHHNDESLREFREAVRLAPNNANAHRSLGVALGEMKRSEEGLAELKEAARLAPSDKDVVRDITFLLVNAGRFDDAVAYCEHSIASDSKDEKAHIVLGNIYYRRADYGNAIKALSASLVVKETLEARLGRAASYMRSGNFSAAVNDCDVLIKADSKSQSAHSIRAFSRMRLGELDAAQRDAEIVLATGKERTDVAHVVLAGVNMMRENYEAATKDFAKAIELRPEKPLPYVMRAAGNLPRMDMNQISKDLDAAIRVSIEPQNLNYELDGFGWEVFKFRGLTAFMLNRENEAVIKDFDQAILLNPNDPDCYALRGWAKMYARQWTQATDDFEKAISIVPDHPIAALLLSNILSSGPNEQERDVSRATRLAKKGCEDTNWKNLDYIQCLAAAYSQQGDFANAIRLQSDVVNKLSGPHLDKPYRIKVWWGSEYILTIFLNQKEAQGLLQQYKQGKPFQLQSSRLVEI